jgi:hypothetical protein
LDGHPPLLDDVRHNLGQDYDISAEQTALWIFVSNFTRLNYVNGMGKKGKALTRVTVHRGTDKRYYCEYYQQGGSSRLRDIGENLVPNKTLT